MPWYYLRISRIEVFGEVRNKNAAREQPFDFLATKHCVELWFLRIYLSFSFAERNPHL